MSHRFESRMLDRREMLTGGALAAAAITLRPFDLLARAEDEITHTSAAIHHRVTFAAPRARVYKALTDAKQFQQVMLLGEAMKGMKSMPAGARPTAIAPAAGGEFVLFGGQIVGRHIELLPNSRLVQAWRDKDWKPGAYSLVRFDLADDNAKTVLTFEHTGFPDDQAAHLSAGWKANYWEPLAKFLAT